VQSYPVQGMNSLLLLSGEEGYRERETPCLRCGKCVSVCPMGLTPNLLHTLSELKRLEDCEKEKIMNCIECGSCQFQCPACRPLLDYIRLGKARTGNMIRNRKI
jgi:electron transport complex protein RnfC